MSAIDRIFQLKEERHLTNKQVEIGAGLANSSLSQWKKGKGKPSLDNIVKISKYFNVSSDYILGLSENRRGDEIIEISLTEEDVLLITGYHKAPAVDRFRIIQLCMNAMDALSSGSDDHPDDTDPRDDSDAPDNSDYSR